MMPIDRSILTSQALWACLLGGVLLTLGCTPPRSNPDGKEPVEGAPEDTATEPGTEVLDPTPVPGGSTPSKSKPCLVDADCKVFQDCCVCSAIFAWEEGTACARACPVPACAQRKIAQPIAYCLAGRCLVGEGTRDTCAADRDCARVEDCHFCAALPRSSASARGFVGCGHPLACDTHGSPGIACLSGQCRFTPLPLP